MMKLFLLFALAIAIYAQPFGGSREGKGAKKKDGSSNPFGGFRITDSADSQEDGKGGKKGGAGNPFGGFRIEDGSSEDEKKKGGKKGNGGNPFGGFRIEDGSSSSEDGKKKGGKKGNGGNPFGGFRIKDDSSSSEDEMKKGGKKGNDGNPFGGFRIEDGSSEQSDKKGGKKDKKGKGGANPFGNFRIAGEDAKPTVVTQLPRGVPPARTRLDQWPGYVGSNYGAFNQFSYASNSYIMGAPQVGGFNYRFPNGMFQQPFGARVAAPVAAPVAAEPTDKPEAKPTMPTMPRVSLPYSGARPIMTSNNRFVNMAPISTVNRAPVWGQQSYGYASNYGSYNLGGSYAPQYSNVRPAFWG